MKKITFILLTICMAGTTFAREATWLTGFNEASDQAARENKLLLLDFTGSDWCGWCQKLDAETFSRPEFRDYAGKNLVLVRVDFPMHKSQSDELKEANRALKDQYAVRGYPTVLVVKPSGTIPTRRRSRTGCFVQGFVEGSMARFAKKARRSPALASLRSSATPNRGNGGLALRQGGFGECTSDRCASSTLRKSVVPCV
jgi:protein disulfide-isomerase